MDILSINADRKLFEIVSSIGRNPLSWHGWFCLNICMRDVEEDYYQEALLWTKSIVESYLQDVEGRIYFCGNQTVHILGKTGTPQIFEQTGQQVCDLVFSESGQIAYHDIYNLVEEGFVYAGYVLEQTDNIFSMPVSVDAGLSSVALSDLERKQNLEIKPPGNTKVLLVEDDPVTRWMVRNALKNECEFVTAPTANKAFAMYASYQPDVVFLDINLPDDNGYSVLEWIMNNDPGACVVMFSSNDNLDNIASALEDGASGFIAKPFLKEQLLHYVQRQG